jgi:phospho-N-acetylmuramoyl-pentapeptide-transferase
MTQASTALALSGIAFLITVIWGAPLVRILRHFRLATMHGDETGAATMGGLLFLVPVTLFAILLNFAAFSGFTGLGSSILLPLAAMLAFAALGFVSDWRFVRARAEDTPVVLPLLAQAALALVSAWVLRHLLDAPEMYLPLLRGEVELGYWYLPAAALVILGTVNAVQTTAAVDSLAGLLAATAYVVFGTIAIVQDQIFIARFCFTLVGALLGFLWFNIKPASLLLGRTGAYALGAALATLALMTGHWILLLLIAIVPLVELASVGVHHWYARYRPARQPLLAAPLHAHLLAGGWSPTQIVQRFWLINLLFATIGFTLAFI